MSEIEVKNLPDYINVIRTTFDGYNDENIDDSKSDTSSGISIGDLNARMEQQRKVGLYA